MANVTSCQSNSYPKTGHRLRLDMVILFITIKLVIPHSLQIPFRVLLLSYAFWFFIRIHYKSYNNEHRNSEIWRMKMLSFFMKKATHLVVTQSCWVLRSWQMCQHWKPLFNVLMNNNEQYMYFYIYIFCCCLRTLSAVAMRQASDKEIPWKAVWQKSTCSCKNTAYLVGRIVIWDTVQLVICLFLQLKM